MQSSNFGVANWLIRLALDGKPITIYGDGRILRDFVFIDDTVDAILKTASSENCVGEIINVGNDKPSSFLELAQAICRHVPGAEMVFTEFSPERKAQEPGDFYSNIDKIRRLVGWNPITSLDEGVRKTVEFYQQEQRNYW